MPDCIVIGGGIVGASVATHLAQAGATVRLYERGQPGQGTTAQSGAYVGHWGYESAAGLDLKRYSLRQYNEWLLASDERPTPAVEPEFQFAGRLVVATTTDGAEDLSRRAAEEAAQAADGGARPETFSRYLSGEALRGATLLPGLSDAVEGALVRANLGFVRRPAAFAAAYLEAARSAGVTVIRDAVTGFATDGNRVSGVRTDAGPESADEVVCAAGPWTPALLDPLEIDLPVEHVVGRVVRFAADPPRTLPSLKHHETERHVRTNHDGTILGVAYERVGRIDPGPITGEPVSQAVIDGLRTTLRSVAPEPAEAPVVDSWTGVLTESPDGDPLLGRVVPGLSVAVASANGIMCAPGMGATIASVLTDADPVVDPAAFSPSRFD